MAGAVAAGRRGVDGAANEEGRRLAQAVQPKGLGEQAQQSRSVDEDARRERIARLAYLKAEQRGFQAGGEMDDWLAAERELDEQEGRGVVG